jgi:hypothetical protein
MGLICVRGFVRNYYRYSLVNFEWANERAGVWVIDMGNTLVRERG